MITSVSNKTAKLVKSLSHKKNRDSKGLFIVEGKRFTSEIPTNVKIEFYAISEELGDKLPALREGVPTFEFSKNVFNCFSDTETPQGIIAVCQKMQRSLQSIFSVSEGGLYIVLEGIKDPGNIGAIIRSADAFGARAILTTENTVDIYNPKVLRSTMGSIFNVPTVSARLIEIIREFRGRGITILGASSSAKDFCFEDDFLNTAVIIGSEAFGLSDVAEKGCDRLIKIPMDGRTESLNAAVAASVIMYEVMMQKRRVRNNVSTQRQQ